ncbi:hypothetical protein ACKVWC_001005 [Pyricularia oryzae]
MTILRQIALFGICVLALLSAVALQTPSLGSNTIEQDLNSHSLSQMPFLELRSEPELKLNIKRDDNQLPGLLGGVLNPLLGGAAPSTPAVPAAPVLPSALPPVLPAPENAQPSAPQVPATSLPIQQAPLPPAPVLPAQTPAQQGGGGILGGIIGGLLGGGDAPAPLPEVPLPGPALAPSPAVPVPAAPAVPGADALNILGGLGGLVTDVIGKTGVLQGVVNGAGPAAPGLGPISLPDVSDIMKAAESAVSDNVPIGDVVAAVAGKVMDTVNEVANTLVPVLNETTSAIVPLADGVSAVLQHPPLGDVLGKVVDTLADFTAQVVNVTTPVLDAVDDLVPLPVSLSNIVQGAAGAVNEVAKGVNELLCDVQGVDAVSVILRKPCTELAASFATVLPEQSPLSIVVTSQTARQTCYLDLALAEAILVTGAQAAGSAPMAYSREEIRRVAMAGHATTVSQDSSVSQIPLHYPHPHFHGLSRLYPREGQADGTPMDNNQCLDMCKNAGYKLAGTEDGTECYCGNYVYNSYLIDDSRCSTPCSGDSTASCGGPWALAIYSPDGKVEVKEPAFTLTEPAPGTPETTLHIGGVRQTVVPVTMPVFMWPPPVGNVLPPMPSSSCTTNTPTTSCTKSAVPSIDAAGLLSSVGAIVSDAMIKASSVESAVLSRASTAIDGAKSMVNGGISSVVGEMNSFISVVAQQTSNPLIGVMPGPVIPSCVGSGPGCVPAASGPIPTGEPVPATGNPSVESTPGSGTPGPGIPSSGTPGSGDTPSDGATPGVPVIATYGQSKVSNSEKVDEEYASNIRQRRQARGRIGAM